VVTKNRARGASSGKAKNWRSARNIAWIERHARIPEGKDVGKPVRLRKFQKLEIERIYDNPHGTRRAIESFGRKNAKTTFAAFLLLLHLCGPEARPNSQLFSAAQSRDQASVLFSLAAKIVRMSPDMLAAVGIRDTAKQLYCSELGTLYRALSADASTAYGLSPVFIVHDELGQVRGPRSELYDALETAVGAQEQPLSVIISTQAPNDGDLLSILIDDALQGHDPQTVVSLYTAPLDLDPFSDEAIKAANPAFGDFLNADLVRGMAEDARRMKSREPEYRNLVLNQRVEMNSPFISRSAWMACGGEVIASFKGLEVYGGLDLSEVADLTALVLVARKDGIWHVKPTFWLPEPGLRERARVDRVPYDIWRDEGFLKTTRGPTVEYEFVAEYLRGLFDELDIRKIGFDRWNWRHLKPWLQKAGFRDGDLDEKTPETAKFEEFGQGFRSMSPALRDLESVILAEKMAHGGHPALTMCAANAVVKPDDAGNRKLSKAKSSGRIDGMVALAMAMSVAGAALEEPAPLDIAAMLG
jgi:phage terminase large subunit-like protein